MLQDSRRCQKRRRAGSGRRAGGRMEEGESGGKMVKAEEYERNNHGATTK